MGILQESAQQVRELLGAESENISLERLVIGIFFTGVKLTNGAGGMCFTPIKEIPEAVCCPSSVGRAFNPFEVKNMKAVDVLSSLSSREPMKKSAAIATLNALSASCWARGLNSGYTIQRKVDALDAVRVEKGKSVALVGAIVPALRALKRRGGTWWVVEQDVRTLKGEELDHYVPAERSEEILRQADVLIITGVTLVNGTLEGILKSAKPEAEIAVVGPSAGLLPGPMFERGVRVVGGVWVQKPDTLLDALAAGGSGYHFLDTLADRIVIEKPHKA